ncbi:MAG: GerW family sporulation protein [Firmicutes bacterium]|nr:GerW family sporulation protein [Bacillota bacterium]
MEGQHPIEGLMKTALDSIKSMVDVNTILGEPVETPGGKVIVPVSRVTFGFAAGGSEFEPADSGEEKRKEGDGEGKNHPFGGGSGAGVSINPMGFLVVSEDEMRILPIGGQAIYDRLLDMAPKVLEQLQGKTKSVKSGIKKIKYKITEED